MGSAADEAGSPWPMNRPRPRGSGWPTQCQVCGDWDALPVCPACLSRFAAARPRCPRCAIAMPGEHECGACLSQPPAYDSALAAVDYAFPWDALLARFKFRSQPELAHALAQRMIATIERSRLPAPALIVPVPLSAQRLRERGYNQAWELARRVAAAFGLAAHGNALARSGDGAHQVGLSRTDRAANLRHRIWVDPAVGARLRGLRVALVDDVMTTGATAEAAAQALRGAGAAHVQVWVLARTPMAG